MLNSKNRNSNPEISQGAMVRYKTGARNPDGSVKWLREFDHNLILDSGLNEVAAQTWAACIQQAAAGTGTNPVERDSGATTFTATAGAVVASANFAEAADIGRLLRLDDGRQGYVTGYTDPQNFTWSGADGAASPGTVYYVNRTALQTEVKRTVTYRTESGDNVQTWNTTNKEWTFQRTFLFSAEVGSVTYRELGWSWAASPAELFGMDVLSGGGDSLVAGQQYLVVCQLVLRLAPATSATAPDVGTGGWNTEGDIALGTITASPTVPTYSFAGVNTNGSTGPSGCLEPSKSGPESSIVFITANFTLPSATDAHVATPAGPVRQAGLSGYVSGSFTRTKGASASTSEALGSVYGFGMTTYTSGGSFALGLKFDTPQTKDNVHTISATFRFNWGRRFS